MVIDRNKFRKPNDFVAFYSDKLSITYLGSNVMKEEGKLPSLSPLISLSCTHKHTNALINRVNLIAPSKH